VYFLVKFTLHVHYTVLLQEKIKQAVLMCVLLLTETSFAQTLYTGSGLNMSHTNRAELKPHKGELLIAIKCRLCRPTLIQL
jgi:hypothetical protein